MRWFIIGIFLVIHSAVYCQVEYYPPVNGDQWETVDGNSLGWQTQLYDGLFTFLSDHHSKSFVVLYKGKMAIEWYADDYGPQKYWYWASAGKSLIASLIGIAQESGWLDIHQKTSDFLGKGWTSAPLEKEDLITIRHQMTMTTGLDDRVDDQNCLDPECLNYRVDAGTRWFYYNAPYRLLADVMAQAGSMNINQVTKTLLGDKIGMGGFWLSYVRWGTARDLARFGLFALGQGQWDGQAVLSDKSYFYDMTHPTQELNPAYGYLWWLNGQDSYIMPGFGFSWPGPIIPNAPADMYAALGADDQKIYVVPSMDLVVVRQGEKAVPEALLALSPFDNELWGLLREILTVNTSTLSGELVWQPTVQVHPNPIRIGQSVIIHNPGQVVEGWLLDLSGKIVWAGKVDSGQNSYDVAIRHPGVYLLTVGLPGIPGQTTKLVFY